MSRTSLLIFLLTGLLLMPFGMVFVGVKNLGECPKEPKIPIYLLVGGCCSFLKLFQTLMTLWRKYRRERFEQGDLIDLDAYELRSNAMRNNGRSFNVYNGTVLIDVLLTAFLLVWFLLGNYWVFRIWLPNYNQPMSNTQNWCGKTVYLFSVIQILACYFLACLVLLVFLILFCFVKFFHTLKSSNSSNSEFYE